MNFYLIKGKEQSNFQQYFFTREYLETSYDTSYLRTRKQFFKQKMKLLKSLCNIELSCSKLKSRFVNLLVSTLKWLKNKCTAIFGAQFLVAQSLHEKPNFLPVFLIYLQESCKFATHFLMYFNKNKETFILITLDDLYVSSHALALSKSNPHTRMANLCNILPQLL
jgi:hypothetical protein